MKVWFEVHEGLRVSLRAVIANKMRSTLTTLGIVIGIVTVTLMGTAIEGLNAAFLKSISSIGSDVLYIQKFPWFGRQQWWEMRNRRNLRLEDAEQVARLATLALAVSPQAVSMRPVKYQNRSASSVFVVGGTAATAQVASLNMTEGRFLSEMEVDGARPVCVIGADLARSLFPQGGALGQRIRIDNTSYQVVGVVGKVGEFLGIVNFDNRVIIPISRYVTDLDRWPNIEIVVKARELDRLDDTIEELRSIMRKLRRLEPGQPDDFAINQQEAFIKVFNELKRAIASVGFFITGLALFVGGIGIMNIMFVSVAERTREIGIRKAIGAKRRAILLQFLLEAALVCLLGGVVGILIAFPFSLLLGQWLPTRMSFPMAGIALLVAAATGLISGLLPAYRAACMNPVDALRNE